MAEEVDEKASGDLVSVTKLAPSVPEPEPIKIPDVELIVDGFGFMPKEKSLSKFEIQSKMKMKKSSKTLKDVKSPESEHSPCASSTNINIVRRYTWKTKNRMTVQVII